MRLLFIGESWLGACPRSLREAFARRTDVLVEEVSEDAWFPRPRALWLRALNRITLPAYRHEFRSEILNRIRAFSPDVLVSYKGSSIGADVLAEIRNLNVMSVNIYPDWNPHAYGEMHRAAVGRYDLVISTKSYHPPLWSELYGYENRCLSVPHGFDPTLHLVSECQSEFAYDVVLVATYRAEYGSLMLDLASALGSARLRVAIGGFGWDACRRALPEHWVFPGPIHGRSYVSLLRRGRICIAPLMPDAFVNGRHYPGDVDTTRTYELAAARCFFIHKRTEFARSIYGESEVPMYEEVGELADMILHYLDHDDVRDGMAEAAHRRAVPAYSLDSRAAAILEILARELGSRGKH